MTARPAEFDARLMRYLPALKNLAAKHTQFDRQQREDLLNDTIMTCLANWQSFREGGGFYAWAVFMLRNCAKELRKRSAKHALASEPLDAITEWQIAVPPAQEHAADLARVMAYVKTMKPRRAVVVRMRAAGFKDGDIAPILGVTKAAVNESFHRSQRELAARFGDRAAA